MSERVRLIKIIVIIIMIIIIIIIIMIIIIIIIINKDTYLYRISLFSTYLLSILLSIRVLLKKLINKVKNIRAELLRDYHTTFTVSIFCLKFTK